MGDLMLWTIRQIQISLAFQLKLPTTKQNPKKSTTLVLTKVSVSFQWPLLGKSVGGESTIIKSGEDVIVVDE